MTERVLPATVVASHLEVCAAELAAGPVPLGELAEVLDHLVTGQRHLSLALASLADRLDTATAAEAASLSEVLRAAASASGHAADALAASEHLVETIVDDTHL